MKKYWKLDNENIIGNLSSIEIFRIVDFNNGDERDESILYLLFKKDVNVNLFEKNRVKFFYMVC